MTNRRIEDAPADRGGGTPQSRQVSWFETFAYAGRLAAQHRVSLDQLPIAGTPQWCGMRDDDAHKLLALVLGGVREALTNDQHQTDMADASHEIASGADWSAISKQLRAGRGPYIPRKAS